jgi:hypothetical protein
MWRKKTGLILLVSLSSIFLATNCAMMTRKSTQRIPVTPYPAGATVSVDGQLKGVTPIGLHLSRKRTNQVIRIESPGYNPFEIRLMKKTWGGAFIGNILLGLLPGFVPAAAYSLSHDGRGVEGIWVLSAAGFGAIFTMFDSLGGAANTIEPKELTVALTKSYGTARVDTLLIEADDLQNIKWIRVRRD